MAAVEGMLDEEHETNITQDKHDHNTYSLGRIHTHNVVIACLPASVDGVAAAATVAKDMSRTFDQLRFGLLVGIGGGIPNLQDGIDIRLGDIVVSEPTGTTGGVVQYDKGKSHEFDGWQRKGILNAPPVSLLTALQRLKARHLRYDSLVPNLIADMLQRYPKMAGNGYRFPGQHHDVLKHTLHNEADGKLDTVSYEVLARPLRKTNDPNIHYGVIASGNQVIKDAALRDRLRQDCNALCVEMEAAGLMNEFPCLVIRGICDYADVHKNDRWHQYAAATAAAYAKELLTYVSPEQANSETPVQQILGTLNEFLERLRTYHGRHEAFLQRQEMQYQTEAQRDCHRAFKTSTYEDYKNRNPERAPGTCQWLLNHPMYLKWQNSSCSDLLWISADPGCGKSVLSRSLVDQELCSNGRKPDTTVCYFFFKDNDHQNSLIAAFDAVLHQLYTHQPRLIRHAMQAWEKNGKQVAYEVDELWRIFLTSVSDQDALHVVCVLDALDECRDADRKRLISMLCQFYGERATARFSNGALKFLVTSRPYQDIEHHFGLIAASLPFVRLRGEDENDQIHEEIDLVVRQCVRDIVKEFSLETATADRLETQLLSMKHRTYLWLHLAISSIREIFSESLRPDHESIELLPATVDEAYEQILNKVKRTQKPQVRAILQIILGAPRPLTMGEMALALGIATAKSIPKSTGELDIREDHLMSQIRHWCGLFVFINNRRLYLIHQTAKEFLLRDPGQTWTESNKWKHCLSAADVEYKIAWIYVVYLCLQEFDTHESVKELSPAVHDDNTKKSIVKYDSLRQATHRQIFFRLASESWPKHWRNVEDIADTVLKDKVWSLYDTQSQCYSKWTKIFDNEAVPGYGRKSNNLMLAAYCGHVGVLSRILDQKVLDIDAQNNAGYTALAHATMEGYEDIVTILLNNGADINKHIRYWGNVLNAAIFYGHDKVTAILLRNNAMVSIRDGDQHDALWLAARNGHLDMVRLLISSGADVNAPAGPNGSALQVACTRGHHDVVYFLLQVGADANVNGGAWGNALHAASANGRLGLVRTLLKYTVDVNAKGRFGGYALQAASCYGYLDIVQTLLDNGADVNLQSEGYHNALHDARSRGHEEVVQSLLRHGAQEPRNDD